MVQHGAIISQVQYLPNTALLTAELHSINMEVLLCAVHLLCAPRPLLYAEAWKQL